jgi:histone-lysine N-methyltransferase SETD1
MSRASKGYADFFPTAPSVLQQKRSRTVQQRKKQKTSAVEEQSQSSLAKEPAEYSQGDGAVEEPSQRTGIPLDRGIVEQNLSVQDDNESIHGDLLNGIGSASSTSTSSSVFSAQQRIVGPSQTGIGTSLTPVTNSDSSPPALSKTPPTHSTQSLLSGIHGQRSGGAVADSTMELDPATLTPISSSPEPMPSQARPGKGEIKGIKAIYDPELDKKLSSKEKKGRKVQYQNFGEEVRRVYPSSADSFEISVLCKY